MFCVSLVLLVKAVNRPIFGLFTRITGKARVLQVSLLVLVICV